MSKVKHSLVEMKQGILQVLSGSNELFTATKKGIIYAKKDKKKRDRS